MIYERWKSPKITKKIPILSYLAKLSVFLLNKILSLKPIYSAWKMNIDFKSRSGETNLQTK